MKESTADKFSSMFKETETKELTIADFIEMLRNASETVHPQGVPWCPPGSKDHTSIGQTIGHLFGEYADIMGNVALLHLESAATKLSSVPVNLLLDATVDTLKLDMDAGHEYHVGLMKAGGLALCLLYANNIAAAPWNRK